MLVQNIGIQTNTIMLMVSSAINTPNRISGQVPDACGPAKAQKLNNAPVPSMPLESSNLNASKRYFIDSGGYTLGGLCQSVRILSIDSFRAPFL